MSKIILDISHPHKELSTWFTDPKSIVDLKINELTKEVIDTCCNSNFILYHNKVKFIAAKYMRDNSWLPDTRAEITRQSMHDAILMYTTSLYWELLKPITDFTIAKDGVFNSATLISMDSQMMVVQLN